MFDEKLQDDILQEECAELIKALSKVKREVHNDYTMKNLIEEISLNMVCEIHGISDSEIENEFEKKYIKYTEVE